MNTASSSHIDERFAAVAAAAAHWSDPEYPARSEAVSATLEAENTFTEEAIAFAVNQQMSLLTSERLRGWIGERFATRPLTVGVLNAGNVPLVGLQDFLAVVLTGHRYAGSTSTRSPALLPAFAAEIEARGPELNASFTEAEALFRASDAIVATGRDETAEWVHAQATAHGIGVDRRLVRGHGYGIAVLDGQESDDDYERLAEDTLLHEGFGCRNVAIIWAPEGLAPDELLDAFARFRGVFPAHESTPRRLKMQQAFLEAIDAPHAYGEGLEFLVSKGEPEAQQPGHVRWTEYTDAAQLLEWIRAHESRIQVVVASDSAVRMLEAAGGIPPPTTLVRPGYAQRPELSWCPDGIDTVDFLARLT